MSAMGGGDRETIQTLRDCEATQIPQGNSVVIPRGTTVIITQALGGTYTVLTEGGYMLRIESKDADAIGRTPEAVSDTDKDGKPLSLKDRIWAQLKTIYDPEIPVNIVELGLIYYCEASPREEGDGYHVYIEMTLTAPGCGMGPVLQKDVEKKIASVEGVRSAEVKIVFEPQWDQSRMSEAARLQLGFM